MFSDVSSCNFCMQAGAGRIGYWDPIWQADTENLLPARFQVHGSADEQLAQAEEPLSTLCLKR